MNPLEILGKYLTLENAITAGIRLYPDGRNWIIAHENLPKVVALIEKAMIEYKNQADESDFKCY